jgi:hypothetical protein
VNILCYVLFFCHCGCNVTYVSLAYWFFFGVVYRCSECFKVKVKVKVKVILQLTVSQPVCLDIRHPSGTRDQFFLFSLWLFFDSFRFVDVGHPLWREVGSVLFSLCWASPMQPLSDLSPTGLMSIVYCLYFWAAPNQEGQVPVFISPRNRVAELYSRALVLSN